MPTYEPTRLEYFAAAAMPSVALYAARREKKTGTLISAEMVAKSALEIAKLTIDEIDSATAAENAARSAQKTTDAPSADDADDGQFDGNVADPAPEPTQPQPDRHVDAPKMAFGSPDDANGGSGYGLDRGKDPDFSAPDAKDWIGGGMGSLMMPDGSLRPLSERKLNHDKFGLEPDHDAVSLELDEIAFVSSLAGGTDGYRKNLVAALEREAKERPQFGFLIRQAVRAILENSKPEVTKNER